MTIMQTVPEALTPPHVRAPMRARHRSKAISALLHFTEGLVIGSIVVVLVWMLI